MLSHNHPRERVRQGRSCRVRTARGWELGAALALFLSTFVNKVDRKGRVSVPATFRASLTGQAFNGIVAYRSFKLPSIEAGGIDRMEEMSARIDTLDEFSEDRDSLSSIFAEAQQLAFDGEGRVVLPEALCLSLIHI